MKKINLVIGANGHLGNNIVRVLLEKGETVLASVRKPNNQKALKGLDCQVTYADIMDRDTLVKAMEGVEVVYHAAAVYKSWAKDIKKEIIDVNIEGTKNVLEAAKIQKVKKLIYISTSHTLDLNKAPLDESTWNNDFSDPYRMSKTEAEKAAWRLAKEYGLWMVSLLPTGIIGTNSYDHLTPTMEALLSILQNKMPIDPCFNMNLVDVCDVANAAYVAAEKGKNGERYLLGQEKPITTTEVFKLAHTLYPNVKIPIKSPNFMTYAMAASIEFICNILNKQPLMSKSQVRTFKSDPTCNISKAKLELNFNPQEQTDIIKKSFRYLKEVIPSSKSN
ncbi:MAG: NAD-dependent epimerase/dehydratase family protein [Bacillota bacterium]|nr:NAD-dependent epimerase/dehydratase family protein [Bacillota bacterium]